MKMMPTCNDATYFANVTYRLVLSYLPGKDWCIKPEPLALS